MIIPPKRLELWRTLRSSQDFKTLEKENPGMGIQLFYRAFKNGFCNDFVFKVMSDFYNAKLRSIKKHSK